MSDELPPHLRPQRDSRGYFLPGSSGGPGRKLGLAATARKIVDPKKLVNIMWAMAQGEPEIRHKDPATGKPVDPATYTGEQPLVVETIYPSIAERQAAARWLWDRIEPKEMKLKLEIEASRPVIRPSGEALDKYIEAREKLRLLESGDAVPSADGESVVDEER